MHKTHNLPKKTMLIINNNFLGAINNEMELLIAFMYNAWQNFRILIATFYMIF